MHHAGFVCVLNFFFFGQKGNLKIISLLFLRLLEVPRADFCVKEVGQNFHENLKEVNLRLAFLCASLLDLASQL